MRSGHCRRIRRPEPATLFGTPKKRNRNRLMENGVGDQNDKIGPRQSGDGAESADGGLLLVSNGNYPPPRSRDVRGRQLTAHEASRRAEPAERAPLSSELRHCTSYSRPKTQP